jgi:hypothetical protein
MKYHPNEARIQKSYIFQYSFLIIFHIRLKNNTANFRVIYPLRFLCVGTELVVKVLYVFYVNYVLSQEYTSGKT